MSKVGYMNFQIPVVNNLYPELDPDRDDDNNIINQSVLVGEGFKLQTYQ